MRRLVQLTLDLFDAAPAPPTALPAPPPAPLPAPATAPPRAAPPAPPAEPLARVLHPAVFAHPQANRQARLGDAVVAYLLRRGRRRTIGFTVGPEGLVVSAPRWVPLGEVDAALCEKSGWIVRKLGEARERAERLAAARIAWADGCELPYLGAPLRLRLDPAGARAGRLPPQAEGAAALLCLPLPRTAGAAQIRDAAQAWLMREARALFAERLDHFAPLLGVHWRKLALSNAQTRWGSARADGSIRLNWRLIHFAPAVIDYVVAHELAHLRVMDHSPRFWDVVATVVPDHAALRSRLRDDAVPRWG
ncbi:SprT family zinc-dependent metalloprotease [Ramlibacter sp. H39-3-26]|uniref:M48 family metallopeptidase n=1 Tax=Curvibacter soli TaxID=3031331 RepID=UPI0023DAF947|nr:SprT family zinc-dependent metalloprotease [Ramlibacter sp. H39-3-26]MDF1486425.1 SprT family zinc-dependent metalloprotease [Ramlibacter sp. H39-3-26]